MKENTLSQVERILQPIVTGFPGLRQSRLNTIKGGEYQRIVEVAIRDRAGIAAMRSRIKNRGAVGSHANDALMRTRSCSLAGISIATAGSVVSSTTSKHCKQHHQ